jgi:glycosyltransferase involved in cell wall biosynthesis
VTVAVLVDRYPELSETFVATEVGALRAAGLTVRVESLAAPAFPAPGVPPPDALWERESTRERLRAMAWLASRHPLRCAADLASRRRWRRDEPVPPLRMLAPAARRLASDEAVSHLHAHFAAGAALAALRLSRILGLPYSVTAHGYDIFQRPANLAEKLREAAFATSGSRYTVEHLRAVAGPGAEVHEIVMGVDPGLFERASAYPGGRTVVAVGRLVEKKGFADLVDAVGLMRDGGDAPGRVVIAGDGPLRGALAARIAARRIGDVVELAGALPHAQVRELLERADVLCMPCVVAADGDRDSMPVVVKEALAMGVPVVATDAVGLPEVVRPGWGALAPPGDPPALAAALRSELSRPPGERAARGRAGRAFVAERFDSRTQAARLAELIGAARNASL